MGDLDRISCLRPAPACGLNTRTGSVRLTTGERLSGSGYLGAGLILAAMILGEFVTLRCRLPARGCRP